MIQITEETPVSSVQRLWQVEPPTGVAMEAWTGIQFAAINYQPMKLLDVATWNTWRGFALSALAMSQPRRHASVSARLGNFARHVKVNRFDYETATVGRLFSDSSLRCTEVFSRNIQFMGKTTLAHVRRDLSALRQGLLLPPRVFRHPSASSLALSNDMSVVRYASKVGPVSIREQAASIVGWFDDKDFLLPLPEKEFMEISRWCSRKSNEQISMENVRVEHAVAHSVKGIAIVDILAIPKLRPELIRRGVVDENTFANLLRSDVEVWTIHNVQSERFAEKEIRVMNNSSSPKDGYVKPRKLSREAIRRIQRQEKHGLTGQAERLPELYEAVLESTRLRCMSPETWLEVKPLVVEIMRRSHIRGEQSFTKHVRVFALYVLWAQMAQRDLTLDSLLTQREIEAWAGTGLTTMGPQTRATYRSLVRSVASHVNPAIDAPPPIRRVPHRTIRPPYAERDVARIEHLGRTLSHAKDRGQFLVCMALGLGAGIDSIDLVTLKLSDVKDHGPDGIEIVISGLRARHTWVTPGYQDRLREGLQLLPSTGMLFTPAQLKNKGTVGRLYEKVNQIGQNKVDIEQGRMRNTWLCLLMNTGIPLSELMTAAGLESARTFGDLLPHARKAVKKNFGHYMQELHA